MGSVKRVIMEVPPGERVTGVGRFEFGDGFSVFDIGDMKIDIPRKGEALCLFGAKTFELLEKKGIPTHYIGLVDNRGKSVRLDELEEPTNKMRIKGLNVPEPKYKKPGEPMNYEGYKQEKVRVIPLEVIIRPKIPVSASIRKRKSPQDLGFKYEDWPDKTIIPEKPIVEFSTKFESSDRYISNEEAMQLSGLSEEELQTVVNYTERIGQIITNHCRSVGLEHEDGKLEFGIANGELMVVDVAGTPDENRFTRNGKSFSKQILRNWYKNNDPLWCRYVDVSKELARERGIVDFRDVCVVKAKELPRKLANLVGMAYQAGENIYAKDLFPVRPLDSIMDDIYSEFNV